MARYVDIDDTGTLNAWCDERASNLFNSRRELEVIRVPVGHTKKSDDEGSCIVPMPTDEAVTNKNQLNTLKEGQDAMQIFIIRQDRSWTTINITESLFRDLSDSLGVYKPFWKCALTFGRKTVENNLEFPGFHSRWTNNSFECSYVLRRVEPNNRDVVEGQLPWSIRQSAVYYKEDLTENQPPKFIVIAPSQSGEQNINQLLDLGALEDSGALCPFNIHRLLIADSLKNWQEYLAFLETKLKYQSDQVILAKSGAERETVPSLLDFDVNFIDRQKLKLLEDLVIDAQTILGSTLNYIKGTRKQVERYHQRPHLGEAHQCILVEILDELDLYIEDVELYLNRSEILHHRADSIAHLLSDLLQYKEAIALKRLAQESQKETIAMYSMTEQSTKDSTAVKILTIITLVYLPTTIVANFFSTQFVNSDSLGNLQVSPQAWLLAAISIPLTALTIVVWWAWVRYFTAVQTPFTQQLTVARIQRRNSLWSMLLKRKPQQGSDLEAGLSLPEVALRQADSTTGTWSTIGKAG